MATTKTPGIRFKRIFTHDWEAKLIALVLAVLLWFVVKVQVDRSRNPQMPTNWPMNSPMSLTK